MTGKFAPKKKSLVPLTEEELNAVTIVFHQYETGLREGTIYTRVRGRSLFGCYSQHNHKHKNMCTKNVL
jgi:hypothetical protein